MAQEETLRMKLVADTQDATKKLEGVKKTTKETSVEAKNAAHDFSIMGVSINSVKTSFGKVIPMAKAMFGTIKAGILSTGIGALLVAFGALMQYFSDSEEGAGKLKQIMSAVGVVFGNVTDIISDAGKALFALMTGNMSEFRAALDEVTNGVKNFGETTKREMGMAIQLEKDRLEMQKFEREALVSKAKVESEIMELRLKARDIEKFSNDERLGFMRQANQLADEQLKKDLKVAEEKLRFQRVENSFSKSTQENLDAEAQLEAEVFRIQRSNFSERKRMKSEEQAIVRAAAAEEKAALLEIEKIRQENATKALKLQDQIRIAQEEEGEKRELLALEIAFEQAQAQEDNYEILMLMATKYAMDKAAIEAKYEKISTDNKDKEDQKKIDLEKKVVAIKQDLAMNALSQLGAIAGRESAIGKAAAVAETIINTHKSATAAYSSMSAIPVVGPALGAIAAGLAVTAGMASVQKIVSTPPPDTTTNMATGGMVGGRGHGTSDSVNTRLSRGESVINARSTRMFRPLLSAINQAGGGRGFDGTMDEGSGGVTAGVVKAFVVSDDITNQQDKLTKIRRKATI